MRYFGMDWGIPFLGTEYKGNFLSNITLEFAMLGIGSTLFPLLLFVGVFEGVKCWVGAFVSEFLLVVWRIFSLSRNAAPGSMLPCILPRVHRGMAAASPDLLRASPAPLRLRGGRVDGGFGENCCWRIWERRFRWRFESNVSVSFDSLSAWIIESHRRRL